MSNSIEQSFIQEYQSQVHIAYQRMGSKLRNTVRSKKDVKGASTIFQIVGKGSASTKARHALVPTMDISHTQITCHIEDYYAGDWVDKLDELKTDTHEKQILANAGAYALGRKSDDIIINALDNNDQRIDANDTGLTKAKILEAYEMLGAKDVPDDGQRYCVIGWRQWTELLDINEFKNADYIGSDQLPWEGVQAKKWLGTTWFAHSGLTLNNGERLCHWYHRSSVGHAIGSDVTADITWHGDRAAHFVNNMMSQGAVVIDKDGIISLPCKES